jgi:hypothetical protein
MDKQGRSTNLLGIGWFPNLAWNFVSIKGILDHDIFGQDGIIAVG